jgi:hypothetical protein
MSNLRNFLESSPMAERLALPSRVVAQELELSPEAVEAMMASGRLEPGEEGRACELEVGGQRVARGRIVRRWGEYYFKVTRMGGEGES